MTIHITDLHEYIILNILCLLEAKFIIRCSCVCKDWANLIYKPYFSHEYLSRGKAPLQLVLEKNSNIVLVTLDEDLYIDTSPCHILVPSEFITDLNIRQIFGVQPSVCLKICTCKITGWILAMDGDYHPFLGYKNSCQPYHMYNPITGQHIVIEKAKEDDLEWCSCALIFASKTNQLKLLVFYVKKGSHRFEAIIQTIGTNIWRSIGEVPCDRRGCKLPILLNERCHWFDYNKAVINCFDSEKEVFQVIQTPPALDHYMSNIGSLDGCLSLSLETINKCCEIWVMKEYGIQNSWTKMIVLNDFEIFRLFALLEPLTCLKNGEILLLWDRSTLICKDEQTDSTMICYNPRSGKHRYFMFDEVPLWEKYA